MTLNLTKISNEIERVKKIHEKDNWEEIEFTVGLEAAVIDKEKDHELLLVHVDCPLNYKPDSDNCTACPELEETIRKDVTQWTAKIINKNYKDEMNKQLKQWEDNIESQKPIKIKEVTKC